jgi:hypothetical protein
MATNVIINLVAAMAIYLTWLTMLSLILRFYGRKFYMVANVIINTLVSMVIYFGRLPTSSLFQWSL